MEQRLQEIGQTILRSAQVDDIPVVAIILYGSRGRGDYSFDSNCDSLTLLSDGTTMLQFVLFPSEFRMISCKLGSIKMYPCCQKDFLHMLTKNPYLDAFYCIITVEEKSIYDRNKHFMKLRKHVEDVPQKQNGKCIEHGLRMSERLGSPKWIEF